MQGSHVIGEQDIPAGSQDEHFESESVKLIETVSCPKPHEALLILENGGGETVGQSIGNR
jgi:hypothetical protein